MKSLSKYLLGILLYFILYNLATSVERGIFTDYFSLSNFSQAATNDYFKLICEITASIFAILLAVITFGFDLLGNNARRRKKFNFLTKWWVALITSTAVSIILISFYSSFKTQDLSQTSNLTSAYFIGISFVLFVLGLFPFTILLLSKTDTINDVEKIIKEYSGKEDFNSLIADELIFYIQEFDRDAYKNHLFPKLNEHILGLIGDANNRQQTNFILQSLLKIWKEGNSEGIRVGDQRYFDLLWKSIEAIYEHAAKRKSKLLHYQPIEDFIRLQIEFLCLNHHISGLAAGVQSLSSIYLKQLQDNCPSEITINDLYWEYEDKFAPSGNQDSDLQWDHINNIMWEIDSLYKIAIELKSKYLFEVIEFEVSSILFNLRYDEVINLGTYQEASIFTNIFSIQFQHAKTALRCNLVESSDDITFFSTFELSEYVESEKIFAKEIIDQFGEYLLACQKIKCLGQYHGIKDLGGIGRLILRKYSQSLTVQVIFSSIIEILCKLNLEIERQESCQNNTNHNQIKKELQSLKNHLIKIDTVSAKNEQVIRIDEILKAF